MAGGGAAGFGALLGDYAASLPPWEVVLKLVLLQAGLTLLGGLAIAKLMARRGARRFPRVTSGAVLLTGTFVFALLLGRSLFGQVGWVHGPSIRRGLTHTTHITQTTSPAVHIQGRLRGSGGRRRCTWRGRGSPCWRACARTETRRRSRVGGPCVRVSVYVCVLMINRSIGVGNWTHLTDPGVYLPQIQLPLPSYPTELGEKNIRPVIIDVAKPESVQACVKEVCAFVPCSTVALSHLSPPPWPSQPTPIHHD